MLNILANSHLIPYIFFIIIADYQAICVKGAICREEQFSPFNPLTRASCSLLFTMENSPGGTMGSEIINCVRQVEGRSELDNEKFPLPNATSS